MYDLFFNLCVTQNIPKNHPVYLGLLYTYCPAAAGFWQAGAPVGPRTLPYNGAWHVLSDYASGDATLSDKLEGFGVSEPMIKDVVGYVEAIKHYRRKYPYKDAPELEHTDDLVKADKVLRFGLQNVFDDNFGGNWRNVYEYGRLWCYVLMDWARHIDGDRDKVRKFKVSAQNIYIRFPRFSSLPVSYPAFVWMTMGNDGTLSQPNLVFLAEDAAHNQFRSAMAVLSAPSLEKVWEVEPRIFALDPINGKAELYEPLEDPNKLMEDLVDLGSAVKEGPFPPVAAYSDPDKCEDCIFRKQCYTGKGELNDAARQKIFTRKSMLRPI